MRGISQLMEKYELQYENLTVKQKLNLELDEGIKMGDSLHYASNMLCVFSATYKEKFIKIDGEARGNR